MEKRKNHTWIRLLGLFMLIILSLADAMSAAWMRIRRKWHEL